MAICSSAGIIFARQNQPYVHMRMRLRIAENGSQKPLPFRNQKPLPIVTPLWYVSPMSKTDKTKPAKVQMLDNLKEVHDHSDGVCNLPTPREWLHMSRWDRRTWGMHNCYYGPKNWVTDVTFARNTGEKMYLADKRRHKYPDWKNR